MRSFRLIPNHVCVRVLTDHAMAGFRKSLVLNREKKTHMRHVLPKRLSLGFSRVTVHSLPWLATSVLQRW